MAPRLYRLLCCVLFLLSPALMAQSQHAAINGRVTDNKGKPIFGINIVLEGTGKGGATDTDGRFTIRGIPPGTYNLLVSGIAYKKQTKSITLTAGQTGKINVRLNESVLQMREEVVVTGKSVAEQIQETGYAVNVVRTEETRQRTADLGEVLARTEGVSVRRTGGLGSGTRFSLAGLTDDQIRIFLDGIPLAFTPYAFGISNVPVNLLARVEIYKGVVPSRFGADALGGAVNLVSQTVAPGLRGSASYQTGSFGTHRMVTMINYWDDKTGISASGGGFYDYANNNYKVDVDIADAQGRLRKVTVPRFHDSYQAFGGNIAVGVKDKQWADEFSIKGFYSGFDKDIQHNQIMAGIPFGEVKTLRTSGGVNLKYRNGISDQFDVDLIIGHNSNERVFVDTARFAYNWFGERILEKNEPGEISGRYGASHQFTWDDNYFARMNAAYQIAKNNTLHLSMAPTFTRRTGDERFAGNFYALNATGALFSWVNGLEYSLDAFHERLQNKLFVKHYIQKQESERDIPNNPDPLVAQREYSYFGWGNGLRLTLSPRLSTKFTYEYAIRMHGRMKCLGTGSSY